MKRLHCPVRPTARRKWHAIRTIAQWLDRFATDQAFRAYVFHGKARSADLNETDVQALVAQKLPFIRQANAQLIVRNMGGEVIKCDRWMQAFLAYAGYSLEELSDRLRQSFIPPGLFDLVIWAYCERRVGIVSRFHSHFKRVWPRGT
jgi:hypothetical protein